MWNEGVGTNGTWETHLVAWVELGGVDKLTAIATEIESKPDNKAPNFRGSTHNVLPEGATRVSTSSLHWEQ